MCPEREPASLASATEAVAYSFRLMCTGSRTNNRRVVHRLGARGSWSPDCAGQRTDPAVMETSDSFNLAGILRALRRHLDLSQADLAARLEVSRGTVGRWESSTRGLTVAELDRVLALADWRLVVVDAGGAVVLPMSSDGVVDRADRRYPAHVDVRPAGPYRDNWGRRGQQWAPGRRWRDRVRAATALTPSDHPSPEAVLDHLEAMMLARRWMALAQECAMRYARMARGEWAAEVPDCFCADECYDKGPCVPDCPCRCEASAH